MQFKHISIVGVGLIGGSFALAARKANIAQRITGWDSKEVLDEACSRGIIDSVESSFSTGGRCDADLVYLAAPVGAIVGFIRTRGLTLKDGAILTDAGSTKREICRAARETLAGSVSFVGGHPMAGSHNAGIAYANAELFHGAPYALISDGSTRESSKGLSTMEDVVRTIGGIPIKLDAEQHDRTMARLSHLPQLMATALACAISHRSDTDLKLAGAGFLEMVRLAASHWSVWEDICRTNADEITLALDELIGEMEAVRSSITAGDLDAIGKAFDDANALTERVRLSTNAD